MPAVPPKSEPESPRPQPEREDVDGDRPRIVSSDELLQGRREMWIEHQGEMYRLRSTAKGKLYLTK